jgi:hypothetical protein
MDVQTGFPINSITPYPNSLNRYSQRIMKRSSLLFLLAVFLLSACGCSLRTPYAMTTAAQTASAAAWTETSLPTATFTPTYTPTLTLTSTTTSTPTITPTPTFAFPKVTVNKALAACLFGPAKAYLWARDLKAGDTGAVWGRAPVGNWLYVKMDLLDIPCWVSPYVVDVAGDPNSVTVEQVRLPITNALYNRPQNVEAVRDGEKVTVTWDEVYRTQDDDYGYFLDVWVCQDGNYVWMPVGRLELPDQYHTWYTFTDQPGCSQPSGGQLYTVEKHGYTDPVTVPWPPF